MAFNINAQVILSGPKNIQKVRSSISKQLSGVTVDVNLKVPKNAAADLGKLNSSLNSLNATLSSLNKNATTATTALNSLSKAGKNLGNFSKNLSSQNQKATKSLDSVGSSAAKAGSQLEEFGKDAALAVRRFSAFTIATGAVFGLVRSISNATSEAIKFERELARVVQVTGATDKQLKGLTRTIDGLSTSLGIDANKLLEVSVTFAQTGQSIDQVAKSIKAVSRASLAATFGDIQKTTEGVIASLSQFKLGADRAEAVLGSLNAVSKSFAVEADDLISVIRRAGGVFAASSVQLGAPEERLRELIGIFTAVRSTTRESADTIATGLRTIFTRIQRPQTIKFLEQFGVQLRATAADAKKFGLAEGDFVGIFESLKRISSEIGGLDTLQLAKVVEELGGVRQVGKLLPALREFEKAERARGVALAGTGSISKDVAIATKTLAVQIENLQQRFGKLIRDVSQSQTFQVIAKTAVSAANAILTLTDALRPALPLLTAFAGIKLAGAAFDFSKGFIGGLKKGGGAGGVGSAVGNLATAGAGGSAGKQNVAAKQASDKQVIAALGKNTIATDKNTQALTAMRTSLTALNTTQSTLVTSANALATQSTQLIAALNKLPAILLRGNGGGSTPLPIRRGPRRRANGGVIPKFAKGGFVNGPSHAQGGVIAELEGGEFVVPKKDAKRQGFAIGTGKGGVPLPSQRGTTRGKRPDRTAKPVKPAKAKSGRLKQLSQFKSNNINGLNGSATFAVEGSENTNRQFSNKIGKAPGKDLYEKLFPSAVSEINSLGGFSKIPSFKVSGETKTLLFKDSQGEVKKNFGAVFDKAARESITSAIENIYDSNLVENIGIPNTPLNLKDGKEFSLEGIFEGAVPTLVGYLAEGLISAVSNISAAGGQAPLDLPRITSKQSKKLQKLFGSEAAGVRLGEVKKRSEDQADLAGKLVAARNSGNKSAKFTRSGLAVGGKIGLQNGGMVPVAISNGEGLVDSATASRIMPLLERARAGDGSAIQALASQRNIIEDIVGAGTGTSDSIKTNLAAGSFVLQKSIMDRIDGQRQSAATGGVIRGRLQGGGFAGVAAASGAIGTAIALASGGLEGLLINLPSLAFGISGLVQNFDELKKKTSSFTKILSKDSREAIKAAKARRAARSLPGAGPVDPRRRFQTQLGRNASTSAASGARPIFAFGDKPRSSKLLSSRADRIANIQAAGKGNLLKSSLKSSSIAKAAKGAKFSIGAIFASLLVEPILDGVEKSLVGAKKRIGEFAGFSEQQGGARTASIVGGTRGAISGALTGASLGAFAGPIGAAIGAAAGAAIGGAIGKATAERDQARFEAVSSTDSASTELSKALEAVAGSGKSNVEALDRTTAALTTFTRTISRNIDNFARASNKDFGVRANISDRSTPDPRGQAMTGGVVASSFDSARNAQRANRDALAQDSLAIDSILESISEDTIKSADELSSSLRTALVEGLDTQGLELVSGLGADATFSDLSNALEQASDGSDLFAARLKNLRAAQAVTIKGLQKTQAVGLKTIVGEDGNAKAFADAAKVSSEFFAREFEKSGDVKKAAEVANKRFASEIKGFANIFGDGKLFRDVDDLAKTVDNLDAAGAAGINASNAIKAAARQLGADPQKLIDITRSFNTFIDSASEGNATVDVAFAKQRLLEESIRNTAKGVDLLVTALSRLGSGVDNAVANFENSASNVKNNVSQILSTQQNVTPVAKGNVFNDPQATQKQIEAGIVRVQSATGGNVGDAEGIAATISVTDQLPGAVKNVIDDLAKTGKDITGGQFADKITSEITGFDKIPDFIQNKLKEQLEQTFQGVSRQGDKKGGVDTVKRFSEEGGIEKLSEISNKTRETFAKLNETVTKFDALILDSANLQVQATRQLVDAQLKAADKTNAFADRFDKFRGGIGKDPLAQATQRLDQKVSILLNKGNVQTSDGGDLLKRRSELEGNISFLKDSIGQATGTDKFDTAALAAFDDPQTKALISELANTTSALEGTKQAIDLLANDTTELAAVEGKLASINESRLTGRQRLTALFKQLANAKNPFDRKKILDEFQRPLVAAAKAQQGIPLSFQEFAALQGDVLQGVNGLLGTVEKNLFGRSDEDILGRFETLLVNNQQTGISALQALGLTAAPAIFGGAAATAQGQTPQEQKLLSTADALLKRSVDLVNGVAQANADAIANQQQILQNELTLTKDVLGQLNQEFEKLRNTILTLNPPDQAPFPAANPPAEFAKGGVVYRATGGMASSPFDAYKKGTDDIPAMLSDGEFVMQKSAVDRIGVGNLNALNNLSGPKRERVLYAEDGGFTGAVNRGLNVAGGGLSNVLEANFERIGLAANAYEDAGVTPELEQLARNLIIANKALQETAKTVEDGTKKQQSFNSAADAFQLGLQKRAGTAGVHRKSIGFGDGITPEKIGESNLEQVQSVKNDVFNTLGDVAQTLTGGDDAGFSRSDFKKANLLGRAEQISGSVGRRASNRNKNKLFNDFERRGIGESDFSKRIEDATQLSQINRGTFANPGTIGFRRGEELQPELQQRLPNGRGGLNALGQRLPDPVSPGKQTRAGGGSSGLGAIVPKTGDIVNGKKLTQPVRDSSRITDEERAVEANRITLGELDIFENDLFGKQGLQEQFKKRQTEGVANLLGAFRSPSNPDSLKTRSGRDLTNFKTRQQNLRQQGTRQGVIPEENPELLGPAIDSLRNLKGNIESGKIPAQEGVLGKIEEKLKVLGLFEKEVFETGKDEAAQTFIKRDEQGKRIVRKPGGSLIGPKLGAEGELAGQIQRDANRLSGLGDSSLVDRAEKEYLKAQQKYQTALKETIRTEGDLSKGSGENLTELGTLFEERQKAFDEFKKAQKIQSKPTTQENRFATQTAAAKPAQTAAAKQQAAAKGLPQTAGGNAFVPDVNEKGQDISRTELTKKLAERDAAVLGTTKKDSTSQDRFPIAGEAGGKPAPLPSPFDLPNESTLPQPFLGGSSLPTPTQRIRSTRRTSNRRGYVPRRGFYAQRAIDARQRRYAQSGAPGLGSRREDFFRNVMQNGGQESLGPKTLEQQNYPRQTAEQQNYRKPPAGSAPTTGPMQIQGAAELNQSLTQMTQVSQQLNAAADKLTNLPALEITINGKIAPVEVILNGTQMLANFKESFQDDIKDAVAKAIRDQKTQLDY